MSSPTVLLVNDDPVQLRQISAVLEGGGYDPIGFVDSAEALAALPAIDGVELFILDLHMPRIDGWKLCRLLRSPEFAAFNGVPVLVVSATFTGDDVRSITHELGANAFLEVPFEPEVLLSHVEQLLAGTRPRRDLTVLVVEDDVALRRSLCRAFEQFGYVSLQAHTAEEARRVWAASTPDAVLLDYHLPDASGEDLLTEISDPSRRTSILVMTGDTDPDLPVRVLSQGADGYLRKPFDVAYAVEMAGKSRRQRSLLRVETVLDARTRELRASETRYRSLFETIPDLIFLVDRGGKIIEANPEAIRILGAHTGALAGQSILEQVVPERTREMGTWLNTVFEQSGRTLDIEMVRADGETLPLELTGRTVEVRGLPAALLVGRDLTGWVKAEKERRQFESQMQHAQRLESLGVLAGGVAHDFNNLLVGILGNASLAMMDLSPDAPEREALHQIEVSARRAAELTQQILVFAGKSNVVYSAVHLSELVRELGGLVEPAVSKKARIRYKLMPGLPAVEGDPGQIRQVVMNLIINASDALGGQSGDIVVRTYLHEFRPNERMEFIGGRLPDAGRYVALQVSDDGSGMSQETLRRIFEPFFTTKSAGRGLGLASTLGIVHAHGGAISVRSAEGRGSTFTVLLPPVPGEAVSDDPEVAEPRGEWKDGGRILVVDDEDAVRGLARAVLSRHGFAVVEAKNGAEGLDLARTTAQDVAAILMDVTMPEMDGVEALGLLRRTHPSVPVLLSSGYPPDGLMESADRDPFTGFIEKPYGPGELMDALQRLLVDSRVRGARVAAGD